MHDSAHTSLWLGPGLALLFLSACTDGGRGLPAQSAGERDAALDDLDAGIDASSEDAGFRGFYAAGFASVMDEASCSSCFMESCAAQIDACRADPACQAWRSCIGDCENPACLHVCLAAMNRASATEITSPFEVAAGAALDLCRVGSCEPACTQELDLFGCRGAYSWPDALWQGSGELSFSVRFVHLLADLPTAGLDVKLCEGADTSCATPLDQTVSDADGVGRLSFAASDAAPSRHHVEVSRDISGTDPENFGPTSVAVLLFPPSPAFVPDVAYLLPILSKAEAEMQGAEPPMAGRGAVIVVAESCAAFPADGLTVELSGSDAITGLTYGIAAPDPDATSTTPSGEAVFTNVSAGPHDVTVRDPSGDILSEGSLFVRDGWVSIVRLEPLTE